MSENNTSAIKPSKKAERKKGRFNIVDLIIIIVAVVLIACIVYVFLPSNIIKGLFADKSVEIEYSVEIVGVDKNFVENIKENDNVLDGVSKAEIGTVTVSSGQPYEEFIYNVTDGSAEYVMIENKQNIIVTITAKASYIEGEGYSVNGTRIAVGEKLNMVFPNYKCECYCIDLTVK